MKQLVDLARPNWTLRGWHAWNWQLALARETGVKLLPVAGPLRVKIPGSVQGALRDAVQHVHPRLPRPAQAGRVCHPRHSARR